MNTVSWLHIALVCLAAINVLTFFLYGIDKWKARHARWRVQESALLWMSVLGGSVGAWLGMRIWHHKTQHNKFRYGVPAILFIQLSVACFIIWLCIFAK